MFTIIDNQIYQVSGEKMRKIIIDNGAVKTDGKVIDYDKSSILITSNELRRQYAKLFKVKENNFNVTDDELLKELDEKDNKIKHLEDELKTKNDEIDKLNKELDEALQVLEQLKTEDHQETNQDEQQSSEPKKG